MGKKFKGNIALMAILAVISIIAVIFLYFTLSSVLATETYYVLGQNVAAKQQITEDLVKPVKVSKGGAPINAIKLDRIKSGTVFTRTPLDAGDVLTNSNTGLNVDTSVGIPDNWGITSINISSNKAAGHIITRGSYMDLIGISEAGSKYIATSVLVLDVNYSTARTTTKAKDQNATQNLNEELQYIIGAPQEIIPLITDATDSGRYKSLRAVLSPKSTNYEARNTQNLGGVYTADLEKPVVDLYKGTDSSFAPILRDNLGRPVTKQSCAANLINPKKLCTKVKDLPNELSGENQEIKQTTPVSTQPSTQSTTTQPSTNTSTQPIKTN